MRGDEIVLVQVRGRLLGLGGGPLLLLPRERFVEEGPSRLRWVPIRDTIGTGAQSWSELLGRCGLQPLVIV